MFAGGIAPVGTNPGGNSSFISRDDRRVGSPCINPVPGVIGLETTECTRTGGSSSSAKF